MNYEMLDVAPQKSIWGHAMALDADGLALHYVKRGQGTPTILLLHGWPGFWYDWRRVLPLLAQTTTVIALDLRGFGTSAKPDWPAQAAYSPKAQARNVLSLLDTLQIESVVVVGYDVGGRVALILARTAPQRVQALVLGATLYPGVGTRVLQSEAQRERWYQHFHTLAQADQIIGHDRETVRLYLSHFYDHWVGNKQSLRPKEFDAIVEMYTQPGAVRGSIAWYRAEAGSGQIIAPLSPDALLPIQQPTTVVWGEKDPILLATWTDRLGDFFARLLRVQILPGIGHFVPFEAPDVLVEAIRSVI
jgi:pimeloyl-ACP methyl ester carboxylesterase